MPRDAVEGGRFGIGTRAMERRDFLVRTGLGLSASLLSSAVQARPLSSEAADARFDWSELRALFDLDPALVHMATFFLASHPRPVREAVERLRAALDKNPIGFLLQNENALEAQALAAAAGYLGVEPTEIALTDSTTMGLGLLYGGLWLQAGQELLTTTHDHYSTETALRLAADRSGARVRHVTLYSDPARASEGEMVAALVAAVRPETRVVALTWVHSGTGVKLPIRRIADELAQVNARREPRDRALLCVDGVHGLGVEDVKLPELGCDFFAAGTHKWMFGPRGTGLVWGRPEAWPLVAPTIPTFDGETYEMWMGVRPDAPRPHSVRVSPGGFHAFEHRWAVPAAFELHQRLGKPRVAARIHALNAQLKDGLAAMRSVTLRTPRSDALSAGIVCFEVAGVQPLEVAQRLFAGGIVASVTPYKTLYARLAASLVTSPEDVERTLAAVRRIAG